MTISNQARFNYLHGYLKEISQKFSYAVKYRDMQSADMYFEILMHNQREFFELLTAKFK